VLAAILAHQGGWDEMLMVAGPIGLFAYILRRANLRAEAAEAAAAGGVDPGEVGQLDDLDGTRELEDRASIESGDVGSE
jgi:hypothetical protein